MRIAPIPFNETKRLEALHRCGLLDSEPEPEFDEITRLASHLCGVPIALVSLVDRDRQWFKSKVGLAVPETSRDVSFCAHAVASGEPLIVPDTHADERFFDNPLVTNDPNIRFYAGIPLVVEEGIQAGTLCVIDRVPREMTPVQLDALTMLARQVMTELRLRCRLAREVAARQEAVDPDLLAPQIHPGQASFEQEWLLARRYRIDRLLGAGGMGAVVAAEDLRTGEPVAIKFLLRETRKRREGVERFVREAKALLRLASEHIVRILDAGNLANGAPYIVMEYLEGEDLCTRLANKGPCKPQELIDLMVQACTAMESAHACGIVHRDLKPANLFLARRAGSGPVLKVLDFGVSKLHEDNLAAAALTGVNTMVGSVYYMAPEQMENGSACDGRADIWSLGVILYEALSNVRPFEGETVPEVCAKVLRGALVPLERRRRSLPRPLCEVVARCLNRDPDQRFATAGQLREALLACR